MKKKVKKTEEVVTEGRTITSILSAEAIVRLGMFLEDTVGGESSNKNRWVKICGLFELSIEDTAIELFSDLDVNAINAVPIKKYELGEILCYLRQSFIRNELDLDPANVILHLFWMANYKSEIGFRTEIERHKMCQTATNFYRV
jgi:hypothetical protein